MIVLLKNEGQIQHRARLTGQLTDLKATTTSEMILPPIAEVIHEVKDIKQVIARKRMKG